MMDDQPQPNQGDGGPVRAGGGVEAVPATTPAPKTAADWIDELNWNTDAHEDVQKIMDACIAQGQRQAKDKLARPLFNQAYEAGFWEGQRQERERCIDVCKRYAENLSDNGQELAAVAARSCIVRMEGR